MQSETGWSSSSEPVSEISSPPANQAGPGIHSLRKKLPRNVLGMTLNSSVVVLSTTLN